MSKLSCFIFLISSIVLTQAQENATVVDDTPPAPKVEVLPDYRAKPPGTVRAKNRETLVDWLLNGCWGPESCPPREPGPVEYPSYNGFYNNKGKPSLGAVDTPLLRKLPAAYEDKVRKPIELNRPNPLEVSEKLFKEVDPIGLFDDRVNVLLVYFGQHVMNEIIDTSRPSCPPEYLNVEIPKNHTYRHEQNVESMPILRSRFDTRTGQAQNNPRQQLNEATPYIDGGAIYGRSKAWSNYLRTDANNIFDPNGMLASSDGGLYPALNTVELPMANPPPPHKHKVYVKQHYTEKLDRFFSE